MGDIHFFFADINLLRLEIENLEQLDCQKLFVGAVPISGFSEPGLGNVKIFAVKMTSLSVFSKNSNNFSLWIEHSLQKRGILFLKNINCFKSVIFAKWFYWRGSGKENADLLTTSIFS